MLHRLIRLFVIGAAVLFSCGPAYADKFADVLSKGVIRIGIPADLPPFGFQNVNREPDEILIK